LLLSGALSCLPVQSYAAGFDCPGLGPGAVSNLLTDLLKLIASGDSADLANEINQITWIGLIPMDFGSHA